MRIHLRVDEEHKTPQQLEQRELSYKAAKVLRAAGYDVEVMEWYTGRSKEANAASIIIKLKG